MLRAAAMVSITCAGARFYKLLYRRVDLAFGSSKSEIVRDVILQVFPFFDRHDQRLWVACTKLYTVCTRETFCSLLLPTELNGGLVGSMVRCNSQSRIWDSQNVLLLSPRRVAKVSECCCRLAWEGFLSAVPFMFHEVLGTAWLLPLSGDKLR